MNLFILSLINTLEALGVKFRASQAHIVWEAPPGVMTAKYMSVLKKFKFQIIRLLHLREQEHYLQSVLNKIVLSDCLDVLSKLLSNCVDLFLIDPPYGINHLGMAWDRGLASDQILKEIYRVAKPGAFVFCFSSYRQDLMAPMIMKLQKIGFVVSFSPFTWVYLNGRPKGHRLGDGVYTGIHPRIANEFVLVAMKPLKEKNHKEQFISNGRGASFMDDCRIPRNDNKVNYEGNGKEGHSEGRFPANIIVSNQALGKVSQYYDVDRWFEKMRDKLPPEAQKTFPHFIVPKPNIAEKDHGLDDFEAKLMTDGKGRPITDGYQHRGNPRKNIHPTVKPLEILSFLITMGCPLGGTVCDSYTGSGSTCIAAKLLGRNFIGIEKDPEYHKIAVARVENASLDVPVLKKTVAYLKKHEKSREQQQDDSPAKAPKPCFFSNMTDEQLKKVYEED